MKRFLGLLLTCALVIGSFAGCSSNVTQDAKGDKIVSEDNKSGNKNAQGGTIKVYTHMAQRVLGEEKKDKAGNTYRDEATAILAHLAKKFTAETSINVEFVTVQNESELEPLFKVKDDAIDVFTCPNWSLEEWAAYAEPYMTLEEGKELYGDYAAAMPNDGTNIYSLQPSKTYNSGVVYNEEVLKSVGYNEVPATIAEFETLCTKLREKKIDPIVLHRVESWPLVNINDYANYLEGYNNVFTAMLKSDTPFNEDEPMGKALKMYATWKAKGFFEAEQFTDFGAAMDAVAYGKAAMMLYGSWVVPQVQGRVPEGKDPSAIKYASAPDFGKGRYILTSPQDNYSISKFSKNKESARKFIEYIADNAQYQADSGFIANKKGVTPIVPELYNIIDTSVKNDETKVLMQAPKTQNTINNEKVLTEAGLYDTTTYPYAGLLYDALDITRPDDWSAYEKQVKAQNEAYAKYKKELDIKWIEE